MKFIIQNIWYLYNLIQFKTECKEADLLGKAKTQFPNVVVTNKLWKVTSRDLKSNKENVYITPYVSVCTGHHCIPKEFKFSGQETFTGIYFKLIITLCVHYFPLIFIFIGFFIKRNTKKSLK